MNNLYIGVLGQVQYGNKGLKKAKKERKKETPLPHQRSNTQWHIVLIEGKAGKKEKMNRPIKGRIPSGISVVLEEGKEGKK